MTSIDPSSKAYRLGQRFGDLISQEFLGSVRGVFNDGSQVETHEFQVNGWDLRIVGTQVVYAKRATQISPYSFIQTGNLSLRGFKGASSTSLSAASMSGNSITLSGGVTLAFNGDQLKVNGVPITEEIETDYDEAEFAKAREPKRHPNGGGLIEGAARVDLSAYIGPDAVVSGSARVSENARVEGRARVGGAARISGHGVVKDHAQVNGSARVYDHAVICEHAEVGGAFRVGGNAVVNGQTRLTGAGSMI